MACILIDYENKCSKSLEGISRLGLTEEDELIFFYSINAPRMTIELHNELEKVPAKKSFISVETGRANALDFQLASYLGYCIQKNTDGKYYIVAKDRGYESVCHFWRNQNVFVERIDELAYYVR